MNASPAVTMREIVASDYRTAAVFERYGLDFCCGGGRTIAQACRDAGIDVRTVLADLDVVLATPAAGTPDYNNWSARTLIDHIVAKHHGYVREALPPLLQHTQKIASVHGGRHPELVHIASLFRHVAP